MNAYVFNYLRINDLKTKTKTIQLFAFHCSSSAAKKEPTGRQPLTSTRSVTTASSSATTASIPGRRMSALDEAEGEDNIHRSAR